MLGRKQTLTLKQRPWQPNSRQISRGKSVPQTLRTAFCRSPHMELCQEHVATMGRIMYDLPQQAGPAPEAREACRACGLGHLPCQESAHLVLPPLVGTKGVQVGKLPATVCTAEQTLAWRAALMNERGCLSRNLRCLGGPTLGPSKKTTYFPREMQGSFDELINTPERHCLGGSARGLPQVVEPLDILADDM